VRRPAYAVILAAAVGLGYLATPGKTSGWVVVQIGVYRGVYNSAYIGMVVALAGAVWLSLGGFYVVRNGITRDESTGVGRLIAATPLKNATYLAAKFLSSVLVLSSMVGVLAVTAVVMQLARGEDRTIAPLDLLSPFVLIALPLMILTAAAALLFESIPLLRAGLGNIVWFFLWTVIALGGQAPNAPLGGIGVHSVVQSLAGDMQAQGIDIKHSGEFSLGLTVIDKPLKTFVWHGFDPSAAFLLGRLEFVAVAVVVALIPTVWFSRFDPARSRRERAQAVGAQAVEASGALAGTSVGPALIQTDYSAERADIFQGRPRTEVRRGSPVLRLFFGEVRILIQGTPLWWWFIVLCLAIIALMVTPVSGVTRIVLPLSWVWPVVLWSRLGTQRHEHGVEAILGAYPSVRLRMVTEWAAGVLLTAVCGIGAAARMMSGHDQQGLLLWVCSALFIPSFAFALGSLSRTHRLFQAIYVPLWYGTVNGMAPVDFMGAIRDSHGAPAGLPPLVLLVGTAVMLVVVYASSVVRRAMS